jgi:FMN-binding protein
VALLRIARTGPILARLAGTALAACCATVPLPARASSAPSLEQVLAETFPGARIERRTLALSAADVKRVASRARARTDERLVTTYIAWRGDTLAGSAWTDRRVVRTREALLLVSVAPDTTVARIDLLAFFEPPDFRPAVRWLALFRGRGARAPLTPPRQVPDVSGATLTSRAVNEAARLALARYELLLAPELARDPGKAR